MGSAHRGRRVVAPIVVVGLLLGHSACFERGGKKRPVVADDAGPAAPTPKTAVPAGPSGDRDPGATITVRLEAEPSHLNPFLAGEAIVMRVALGDIYEGLLCTAYPGAEAMPCLATSVRTTDGGKRWEFELRSGVRWHDGQPFTAADAAFTFGLFGDKRVATWLASDFDDLTGVEVTGNNKLTITFKGYRLGRREAFARVPILPRHLFDNDVAAMATSPVNRAPIGTGPLRFVRWTPGESIELGRAEGYWREPAGAARVVYRIMPGRQRAANALVAGSLDLAIQLPVDEAIAIAGRSDELQMFSYDRPAYLAAVYNTRSGALAKVEVRRALTMLMDRPGLAREIFGGYARVISGPYLEGAGEADPAIEPLRFDVTAARRLVGAAKPRLMVLTPAGSRTMGRVADIWTADAKPVIDLVVEPVPYADLLARLREGRFDVALMAFTTARDIDLFTRFHSSEVGGENYGGLRDAALDRALEAVRNESDAERRRAAHHTVHRRLHQLQPYTFIVGDTRMGISRRNVGGLEDGGALSARRLWRAR